MLAFISTLSGTTMVVDIHIMPQSAVYMTNFFNRDSSVGYFFSRIIKYNKHPHYAYRMKLQEVKTMYSPIDKGSVNSPCPTLFIAATLNE